MTKERSNINDRYDDLIMLLKKRRYMEVTVPLVSSLEPFMELSSASVRKQIVTVPMYKGADLCLRPDFTIPICSCYAAAGVYTEKRYFYSGSVFRLIDGDCFELKQLGVELLGVSNMIEADTEILLVLEDILRVCDFGSYGIKLGDVGLKNAILSSGRRDFGTNDDNGQRNSIEKHPLKVWREDDRYMKRWQTEGDAAFFESPPLLDWSDEELNGRRLESIKRRFTGKVNAGKRRFNGTPSTKDAEQQYYKICSDINGLEALLNKMFRGGSWKENKTDVSALVESVKDLRGSRIDWAKILFDSSFILDFEYYSGLILEVSGINLHNIKVRGGRYDYLVEALGGRRVPAIGFAVTYDVTKVSS